MRADLLIQPHLIIFLRVFDHRAGHNAFFELALSAIHAELQKRHVGSFRIHFVALKRRFGGSERGRGSFQIRAGSTHNGCELNLVQFGKHLAHPHAVAIIHENLLHDAAGLGFDFCFRERLDLPRSHHHARQIATLDGSKL